MDEKRVLERIATEAMTIEDAKVLAQQALNGAAGAVQDRPDALKEFVSPIWRHVHDARAERDAAEARVGELTRERDAALAIGAGRERDETLIRCGELEAALRKVVVKANAALPFRPDHRYALQDVREMATAALSAAGEAEPEPGDQAELEWSAYAVTLNQRLERMIALAERRGIDTDAIGQALADKPEPDRENRAGN